MKQHDTDDIRPSAGSLADGDPALPQLPLLGLHRPVRRRDVHERRRTTSAPGLKGRFQEERRDDDHRLHDHPRSSQSGDHDITTREVTQLAGLNHDLRDEYVADCQKGVDRWNRALEEVGGTG